MSKKSVKASEVLKDIKAGMTDAALMEKYGLTEKGLESLFRKLLDGGLLKQSELDNRKALLEKAIELAWECPACGKPQSKAFDECRECGVNVQEFLAKRASESTDRLMAEDKVKQAPNESTGPLASRGLKEFVKKPLIAAGVGGLGVMMLMLLIFFVVAEKKEPTKSVQPMTSVPSAQQSAAKRDVPDRYTFIEKAKALAGAVSPIKNPALNPAFIDACLDRPFAFRNSGPRCISRKFVLGRFCYVSPWMVRDG